MDGVPCAHYLWKLAKGVREINDYQAKRFAKTLGKNTK